MRRSMNLITRLSLFVVTYLAYIGLSVAQPTPQPSNQQLSPEELQLRDEWRVSMAQVPKPKKGCFQAEYPSREWREIACIAPPNRPFLPKRSPRPFFQVGNGNETSAQAPTGFISTAIGSFEPTTNVTSEMGQNFGSGPQYADAYSLQINTNFFPTGATPCDTFNGPSLNQQCSWEQFIYANFGAAPGAMNQAFIEYWLINYLNVNPNCPATPPNTPVWMTAGNSCVMNSMAVPVPSNQPAASLGQYMLIGNVTPMSDSVTFAGLGGKMYAMNGDNAVEAAAGWTIAEFNVFANGGGCVQTVPGVGPCLNPANFNTGAEVDIRNRIIYGGTNPPICVSGGFTGETNNLSFPGSPPLPSMPGPALLFDMNQTDVNSAACAYASTVGDTHLTTFPGMPPLSGLFYDFQASGDFVMAQVEQQVVPDVGVPQQVVPNFVVQARQVSGAPTWPNAAVNHGIATQMGRDTVAVCLNEPFLFADLFVNGQLINLGDGMVFSTPNGADIWRIGNAYNITDQLGNSVKAVANAEGGTSTSWINVSVGLGQWPPTVSAPVTGPLANANGNVNQIATSGGTVLTAPFAFGEFYQDFAQSWRVAGEGSLLSACGEAVETGNPQIPFYAISLNPALYNTTRAVCTAAGVTGTALLDACTLDVAVIGNNAAAQVFVNAPQPVKVGNIFIDPNQVK